MGLSVWQIGQTATKEFGFQMYSSSFRLTNRDIDLALEAGHLFLVYQPKIELVTGRVLAAEAYVRWDHPDYGLMPPGLFLSFFERRERSGDLTRFVVGAAADAMVHWHAHGQHWPVSINLSGNDLSDPTLPGVLAGIVGERGLDTSEITLEIPEGVFARNAEHSASAIAEMRRLGFRTALDGGGAVVVPTEYVTPAYFSEVKVSGASIIRFAQRLRNAGLGFIGRRVSLAAKLGLDATAVGVEDETTLSGLATVGFTAAQGTHICRPRSAVELLGWSFAQDMREDFILAASDAGTGDVLHFKATIHPEVSPPPEVVDEDILLLDNSLPPLELFLSYEDHDIAIPGQDGLEICVGALDSACFFPGRNLIAMLRWRPRHGRRIAGIERPIRMRVRTPRPRSKNIFARALGF